MKSSLCFWNVLVTLVHSSSFVALVIVTSVNSDLVRHVPIWGSDGASLLQIGSYPLAATLLPFPAITAIFHILAACGAFDYYRDVLVRGQNRLRWVEYSITNGLMSWSLTFVAGDGAFALLAVTTVLSNFVMQYFGYLHEKTRSMIHLLLGFIPWAFNWTAVFIVFSARTAPSLTDTLAIWGSFVWSICFTLPLFYRYFSGAREREAVVRANYRVELAYILLSLSAKLWLDWVITGGTLSGI